MYYWTTLSPPYIIAKNPFNIISYIIHLYTIQDICKVFLSYFTMSIFDGNENICLTFLFLMSRFNHILIQFIYFHYQRILCLVAYFHICQATILSIIILRWTICILIDPFNFKTFSLSYHIIFIIIPSISLFNHLLNMKIYITRREECPRIVQYTSTVLQNNIYSSFSSSTLLSPSCSLFCLLFWWKALWQKFAYIRRQRTLKWYQSTKVLLPHLFT